MNKHIKIVASVIIAVVVIFAPIFTENTNKIVLLYEWEQLNTSISNTTWKIDELIETEEIEENTTEIAEVTYRTVVVNQTGRFKSYMPYTTIKDRTSRQYRVRQLAYTSEYGLRKVGERYCVAVGTSITSKAGTYIDVILQNGTVIPCVVGDIKADIHTNADNITTSDNGCVCEFLVDERKLPYVVKNNVGTGSGNISDCYEEWSSPVKEIIVYERSVLDE